MTQVRTLGLVDLLTHFVDQSPPSKIPVTITFETGNVQCLNRALEAMDDETRIMFLRELFREWRQWKRPSVDTETEPAETMDILHQLFGGDIDLIIGRQLLFTRTANGQHFDAWWGIPSTITPSSVTGDTCLMSMLGSRKDVDAYVTAIIESFGGWLSPVEVNGVTFWMQLKSNW